MSLLIGIDLGTTALKSGLFDAEGNLLALASSQYPVICPEPNWAEQDPELWWRACTRTFAAISSGINRDEIRALCVVGQSPTLVAVDEQGRPTRPAIIWADRRALAEAKEISSKLGLEVDLYSVFAKAAWVQANDREAYGRTRWFLQASEYLIFKMTGQAVAIEAIAGWPAWPDEQVAAAGLDRDKIPGTTYRICERVGELSAPAARATGLKGGIPIIAGTIDSFAAWLGTGAVDKGVLCNECGATAGVALCWDRPLLDPKNRVQSVLHPAGKGWIVGGAMSTGSKLLDWFKEKFYPAGSTIAGVVDEAEGIAAGSEGLIALPYLMGERAPIYDANARGAFLGIAPHHTRAHFARALLEGVAFAVRDTCRAIEEIGGEIYQVRLAGGGAKSYLWNQIRADVLGKSVLVPEVLESALLGSSIIAAAGLGIYPSLEKAMGEMVKIGYQIEPDQARHRRYSELFQIYCGAYGNLRESFSRLNELVACGGVE